MSFGLASKHRTIPSFAGRRGREPIASMCANPRLVLIGKASLLFPCVRAAKGFVCVKIAENRAVLVGDNPRPMLNQGRESWAGH